MSDELPRGQVRPGEVCESCGARPAEQIIFRSGNLMTDAQGRVVAEVEARVAVCRPCWTEIVGGRKGMPPGRITCRVDPATGMMEPV